MASIKSAKVELPKTFQIELAKGWLLDIDTNTVPTKYTLTHGKKSMSFHSEVAKDLCTRNYCVRLAHGRRQMTLPPDILQAFADYEVFLNWYDAGM